MKLARNPIASDQCNVRTIGSQTLTVVVTAIHLRVIAQRCLTIRPSVGSK